MDVITLILTVVLVVVIAIIVYTRKTKPNKECKVEIKCIPGLSESESKDGQIIFGEFSQFLKNLHQRFGPVVSFYQNSVYAVSVADPELMKSMRHLDTKTKSVFFEQFEIVSGKEAFGFQTLDEIRRRRKLYDHHFMLKACKSYSECFVQIAEEYVEKFSKLSKDDHLPLWETASDATFKGILRSNYGDYFKNEQSLKHFKQLFETMIKLIEKEIKPNSPEQLQLIENGNEMKNIIKKILISREQDTGDSERNLFIDVLLEDTKNIETQIADSMFFIIGGYEITGKLIMWALYELSAQPELQEKVYEELKSVLGDKRISLELLPKLRYLSQVVDETIRYRMETLINIRDIKEELKIGDYVVPANTRVFINTGFSFKDEKYFANPEKFDPDHFAPENTKSRHAYAWKPFGFAGKRQCPGQSYARSKITIFLGAWIRRFKFTLVPDQDLKFALGFMIRPEVDVWVTLKSRN